MDDDRDWYRDAMPAAVQDAIVGLHAQMFYCVAYDLDGDRIASMRAYGALGAIMPNCVRFGTPLGRRRDARQPRTIPSGTTFSGS
jgi:hypothetical protein